MRGFEARTKSVFAALGVMAVLALAGCSDPAEPSTLPEDGNDEQTNQTDEKPEPEPEDTPTPEPTKGGGMVTENYEPVDAAKEAEVEEFILEFMDASDKGWLTGDNTEAQASYADDCDTCREQDEYQEEIYTAGGSIEGGEWVDPKPDVIGQSGDQIRVNVPVGVRAYKAFDSDGRVIDSEPAGEELNKFVLVEAAGEWKITKWTRS